MGAHEHGHIALAEGSLADQGETIPSQLDQMRYLRCDGAGDQRLCRFHGQGFIFPSERAGRQKPTFERGPRFAVEGQDIMPGGRGRFCRAESDFFVNEGPCGLRKQRVDGRNEARLRTPVMVEGITGLNSVRRLHVGKDIGSAKQRRHERWRIEPDRYPGIHRSARLCTACGWPQPAPCRPP